MKNFTLTWVAAGALLFSLGSCSSTNTDTTTTNTTAEEVATDRTADRTQADVTANVPTPAGDNTSSARMDTTSFHAIAASNDVVEIQASVQAKARAQHPEVKKFAEQMMTDHTRTSEELKRIAGPKNIIIQNSPIPAHQRLLNDLMEEEDADEFDEEYMEMQVLLHKQAVELFESAAKNETDPELKAFAAKHLPALRSHLDMAKRTKDLVKK